MLAHQLIHLHNIDLVAGKPEFHLNLVLVQLTQDYSRLTVVQAQRFILQMLQPVTQGLDPALPAATVAAARHGILERLGISLETFTAGPFEQTVEKGAGIRPTGKAMDIAAAE